MSNLDAPNSILRQSRLVKNYIIERCNMLQVDPVAVAALVGMPAGMIKSWLNAPTPEAMMDMPEEKLVELLNMVGVEVKIHLIVTPVQELPMEIIDKLRPIQK